MVTDSKRTGAKHNVPFKKHEKPLKENRLSAQESFKVSKLAGLLDSAPSKHLVDRKNSHTQFLSPKARGVLKAIRIFRSLKHKALRRRSYRFLNILLISTVAGFILTLWCTLRVQGLIGSREGNQMCEKNMTEDKYDMLWSMVLVAASVLLSTIGSGIFFLLCFCIQRLPYDIVVDDRKLSLDELLEECSTGDIILFSYPVRFNGFFSGFALDIIVTICLKLQGRVHWTHVGVIVRGTDGKPYLAEATTDKTASGHTGPGVSLLRDRLSNSKDYDTIAWRRLMKDGVIESREKRIPVQRGKRELFVFKWTTDLGRKSTPSSSYYRYSLDIYRAGGKIAYDLGFRKIGRLLINSGYDFEFDCCYFAGRVLQLLGIVAEKDEWVLRMFSCPHFSMMDRPDKCYYLPVNPGYDWQVPITIDVWT